MKEKKEGKDKEITSKEAIKDLVKKGIKKEVKKEKKTEQKERLEGKKQTALLWKV